jgi:glycosyltransferase involved in cell wall biosynthesis
VPVITTNCPGVVEMLNDKISIVVNSIDEMSKKLSEIIANKEIAKHYAKNISLHYKCESKEKRIEDITELL